MDITGHMLTNWKRNVINRDETGRCLYNQDFFDVIDRRTKVVNGHTVEYVTRINYDVVGLALAAVQRRNATRAQNLVLLGKGDEVSVAV